MAIAITTIRITMPSMMLKRLRLPSVYGMREVKTASKKKDIKMEVTITQRV